MPEQEPTGEPTVCDSRTQSAIMIVLLVHHDQRPQATEELINISAAHKTCLTLISTFTATG